MRDSTFIKRDRNRIKHSSLCCLYFDENAAKSRLITKTHHVSSMTQSQSTPTLCHPCRETGESTGTVMLYTAYTGWTQKVSLLQ